MMRRIFNGRLNKRKPVRQVAVRLTEHRTRERRDYVAQLPTRPVLLGF